ncbi:MAG: HAD-IA family hydrolase [Pseudomonadota bacterium]
MGRTAIFDLDGTLVDTADDLIAAMNAIAPRFDLPALDPIEARPVAGRGGRALMRHAAAKVGREFPDDQVLVAYPPFLDAYEACIADNSRYFPGVEDTIDALLSAGWRVGICTNKPERLARLLIDELGGGHRFGALLGADTLPVRKPDPEHVLETIRRVEGDAARAVMIGDTENDRSAAANAGVPCALYARGFSTIPLADLKAEAVFDDYAALPPILSRLIGESA